MIVHSRDVDVVVVDPSNFTIPYDLHLLAALRSRGLEARLACRLPRPEERQLPTEAADARFYRRTDRLARTDEFRSLGRWSKGAEHLLDMAGMLAAPAYRQAILHFQWFMLPSIDRLLLQALRRGRRLIVTVHDTEPLAGSDHSRFQTQGLIPLLESADHLLVHTEESRARLLRRGIPAAKVSVQAHPVMPLPPAVPGDLPRRVARWWDAPLRLLLFGHLKPYKGIDVLLEALSSLDDPSRQGVHVLLAGRSAYGAGELERRVTTLGLQDVVTVEDAFLPDGELSAAIERAHLLLFPYLQIDASGAILSALPTGKQMVLSRLPTIVQTVPVLPGFTFVEPGRAADLARALREAMAAARATTPGPHNRDVAMPTWQDMADRLLALYGRTRVPS